MKPIGEFLVDYDDQIDETGQVAFGVEDEYLLDKDTVFSWKAYRTALRKDIALLKSNDKVDVRGLLLSWRKAKNPPLETKEEEKEVKEEEPQESNDTTELKEEEKESPKKRELEDMHVDESEEVERKRAKTEEKPEN